MRLRCYVQAGRGLVTVCTSAVRFLTLALHSTHATAQVLSLSPFLPIRPSLNDLIS
uniref:Uncharacterized protein n=1 Tax=Arundo donax TaxID=35708 RepID=A0A0A8ZT47_ARUDO